MQLWDEIDQVHSNLLNQQRIDQIQLMKRHMSAFHVADQLQFDILVSIVREGLDTKNSIAKVAMNNYTYKMRYKQPQNTLLRVLSAIQDNRPCHLSYDEFVSMYQREINGIETHERLIYTILIEEETESLPSIENFQQEHNSQRRKFKCQLRQNGGE